MAQIVAAPGGAWADRLTRLTTCRPAAAPWTEAPSGLDVAVGQRAIAGCFPGCHSLPVKKLTRHQFPRRWPLRWAVVTSILGAALLVCFLMSAFSHLLFGVWKPWRAPRGTLTISDVVKLALTIVAGLAGVQALVVAYRRQRDAEEDDNTYVTRFESAASQLGAADHAVRLAGVYAMSSLADVWARGRGQCVDVLCGYLRLPLPNQGDPQPMIAEARVRSAITKVIAQHLRPEHPTGWSDHEFDLTDAHVYELRLDQAVAKRPFIARGASFYGLTRITASRFEAGADFSHSIFVGQLVIGDMDQLLGKTEQTTFSGVASFEGAEFVDGISVVNASFEGRASFINSKIGGRLALFAVCDFQSQVSFAEAEVEPSPAIFTQCRFQSAASFFSARFSGSGHFPSCTFEGSLNFDAADFPAPGDGVNDILAGAEFDASQVSWGAVPPRCEWNAKAQRTIFQPADGSEIPVGAFMFFSDTSGATRRLTVSAGGSDMLMPHS